MAVRTTVVGSWWWPEEHEHELRRYHDGELGEEQGIELLDRCAGAAIAEQRELGLDEWTGGEYFTDNFIDQLKRRITGIEIDPSAGGDELFDYDDLAQGRIVGEIEAPDGLGYVEAFHRENELPGGVLKATVVSPLEVTIHEAQDAERLAQQNAQPHSDRQPRAASARGGRVPARRARRARRRDHGEHGPHDPRRGRGDARPVGRDPQAPGGVVDVANLEASYFSEWQERDAFRELPESIELAAGIVDEANYWVEPVAKIRSRAADWARVVGEERLWISPSCGFGRHPARDRPVLRAKVENMVEAARSL